VLWKNFKIKIKMDKTTKTLLVGAGATGVAFAVHKFSKTKVNPYILGGAVLIATIGAYMYFDKQEKTISVTIS
jgi:hypothetical protein